MSDSFNTLFLCHFAPKYLFGILRDIVPSDWIVWDPEKVTPDLNDESRQGVETLIREGRVLPFVLCEFKQDLRRVGVKCPYEFIVERNDLVQWGEGEQLFVTQIQKRIAVITRINGMPKFAQLKDWFAGTFRRYLCLDERVHGNSGCLELKKGELAGKMLMEPGYEKIRQDLVSRFDGNDPKNLQGADEMLRLHSLMRVLFDEDIKGDFGDFRRFYKNLSNADKTTIENWGNAIYGGTEHQGIPQGEGDRIRYVTPTGRLNVLYIDDYPKIEVGMERQRPLDGLARNRVEEASAEKSLECQDVNGLDDLVSKIEKCKGSLNSCPRDAAEERGRLRGELRNLLGQKKKYEDSLSGKSNGRETTDENKKHGDMPFCFHTMKVDASEFGKGRLVQMVEQKLKRAQQWGLGYDLIFLDLNLGDKRVGSDLSGYHLIKVLKKCLPNVPIVIYSKSEDMGHIVRAFQCGAVWYLKKSEPEKIQRHVMELFKRSVWQEDWRAMKECFEIQFVYDCKSQEFEDKFKRCEGWQYLTAKCLEYYPGKFVTISEMGGGLSTAVTFKARKGLRLDGCDLQAPVIVKIDTAYNTHMEYERYFRWIRPYMSNAAGRIEAPGVVLDRDTSAIVYTFAGRNDGSHRLVSLKEMIERDILFRSSCDFTKYERVFDMLFDDILPKIHRVTPDREFGSGGKNRHVEVYSRPEALDAKPSEDAFFPNMAFGEVESKEFWRPYVRRFPVVKYYRLTDDAKFVDQPYCDFGRSCGERKNMLGGVKDLVHFVYHEQKWDEDAAEYQIVAYDKDDRQVVLSGSVVDHIVRFRHLVQPGTSLWLKNGSYEGISVKDKDELVVQKNQKGGYTELIDKLDRLSKELFPSGDIEIDEDRRVLLASKVNLFKCPLAICHGDLNFGNIMVEQSATGIADPWLIDFARTRRDLIAHDFNVLFTATFSLLFNSKLFEAPKDEKEVEKSKEGGEASNKGDEGNGASKGYYENHEDALKRTLPRFIKDVLFAENENPPDYIASDARLTFVYRILMRIRRAAMKAGISRHMYVLTTALESLLAVWFHLKHGKNVNAAKAFVDIAQECHAWLEKELELDLLKKCGQKKGGSI